MVDHRLLPPELWFEIFEWATVNSTLCAAEWTPFEAIPDNARDPSIHTRATISRVCSIWRRWVTPLLFKDIKIRNGAHALQLVLEKHAGSEAVGRRYGDMVRRVVLPYPSTVPELGKATQSIEILKLCTHMHTLLRPQHSMLDGLRFDREVTGVVLPSLQRLEWCFNGEADRSGGINSLCCMLRNAPQISFLFIGGVVGNHYMCMDPWPIELSRLDTLRLNIRSGSLLRQIMLRWSMPSLTRLIIDSPPVKEGLDSLWETFGSRLEVVELGKHMRFLMNNDLPPCVEGCPNLKELHYYLFFTNPPDHVPYHAHLTTVRLHAAVNGLLVEGSALWGLIRRHWDFLCSDNLEALQRIVLHGNWRPILTHPSFQDIQQEIKAKGRTIELASQQYDLKYRI
ncbi:hypothetical protein D9619_002712 [Psilocybe cf. subviscida]|uniref:F-box domain-containing protein n=1 Tax=Psilocybe cf. subviscida TaxID=2480587 RepID=A0A8H5AYJ8_9AGAR|nr:hypothetical protein D9619_002712 [Psilocybe cf. subviscida]